ncbi:MAG: hypothetical protein EHM39_11085, partial [Chloroflexi bacterium]
MKACPICHETGRQVRQVGECWLLRCHACGFVYADATVEEIERVNSQYDESAERHYAEVQTGIDYLWFDLVSRRLTRGQAGLKVLDIGCGW